jgi:hypothetical protein
MVERAESNRKNIMREFTITELSAVDRPAQEHARAVIMKRAGEQQEHDHMHYQKITRDEPISFPTLEAAMGHLRDVRGMGGADAMSAAAREHPDLLAKYQHEGDERIGKALERMPSPGAPPAVGEFNALVDRIRRRDMCTGTEALRRAKAEDPRLFEQYQAT